MTVPPTDNLVTSIYATGAIGTAVWWKGSVVVSEDLWSLFMDMLFCGGGYYWARLPEGGKRRFNSVEEAMENTYVAQQILVGLGLTTTVHYQDGSKEVFNA